MEQNNHNGNGNLMKVLSFVADQTMALAKENSVLGEPIEREGITVIPVSKLTVGFAGGGADVVDANRKKRQHPAGGGANVALTPMSFLVISDGEAKVLGINAPKNSAKSEIIDAVFQTVKDFLGKNKKEEK